MSAPTLFDSEWVMVSETFRDGDPVPLSTHRSTQHGWASPEAAVASWRSRWGNVTPYRNGYEEVRDIIGGAGMPGFRSVQRVWFEVTA